MTSYEPELRPPRIDALPATPAEAVEQFMLRVPQCTLHLGISKDRARLRFWLLTFAENYADSMRRRRTS